MRLSQPVVGHPVVGHLLGNPAGGHRCAPGQRDAVRRTPSLGWRHRGRRVSGGKCGGDARAAARHEGRTRHALRLKASSSSRPTSAGFAGVGRRSVNFSTTFERTPRLPRRSGQLRPTTTFSRSSFSVETTTSWELVDGQQRLTTLFLITKYISTKLQDAQVEYSPDLRDAGGQPRVPRRPGPFAQATRTSTSSTWRRRTTRSRSGSRAEHGSPLQSAIDLHTALAEVGATSSGTRRPRARTRTSCSPASTATASR